MVRTYIVTVEDCVDIVTDVIRAQTAKGALKRARRYLNRDMSRHNGPKKWTVTRDEEG